MACKHKTASMNSLYNHDFKINLCCNGMGAIFFHTYQLIAKVGFCEL